MASTASMTTQYFEYQRELENRYGNKSIVLWMCGSFYETYGLYSGKDKISPAIHHSIDYQIGNIEEISKIIGNAMTKRSKERPLTIDNPYMCGFPAHALSKYLAKLLQYQYTVAVYDQFESNDPRKEKERRLMKIYSPSTYISEENETNNTLLCCCFESYICPITKNQRLYGTASHIDLATGHSGSFEFYDDDDHPNHTLQEIYKLIYCIDPSEIVLIDQASSRGVASANTKSQEIIKNLQDDLSNIMVHELPKQANFYDNIFQEEFLNKIFKNHKTSDRTKTINWLEYIGFPSADSAACFIQLLQFTYEHDEHIIDRISIPQINKSKQILYLNQDATFNLNLLSSCMNNQGVKSRSSTMSCFSLMNRTQTKMGERLLKTRISRPITNQDELNNRYDMIDMVKPHHRNYTEVLKSIIDIDKKYRQIILERSRPVEFNDLYISLAKSKEILLMNDNLFSIPSDKLKCISKMIKFITTHFNSDSITNGENDSNVFNQGIFPELDKLYNRINEIKTIIKDFDTAINAFGSNNFIRASINISLDKQGHCILTTTKRAYDSIQKLISSSSTSDWSYRIKYSGSQKQLVFKIGDLKVDSTVNQHVRLRSSLFDKFAQMLEKYTTAAHAESNKLFEKLMKQFISQYDDTVRYVSHTIAKIDIAVSSAIISIENYYVRPQLVDTKKGEFKVIGLRHPLIEKIADDSEYITNNVELNPQSLGILLYGLNSSGKSSLLRAIGTNIVLAQAGLYCSCDSFTLSCYESLFTKISTVDNLFKGQSTFVAEMCCLKDMLQQSNEKSIVLCDELTAGTETNSATGIVASAIIAFIQKNTNFIFTTHLHSLMDFPEINNNNKLQIYHFKVSTKDDKIIQERKLIPGSGDSQYGIEIAHAIGLPKQFIAKAYEFRRNFQGLDNQLLSNKRSRYNSKVIVDTCTECGYKPTKQSQYLHVHHQHHQADSNDYGKIKGKSFHKNIRHNLIVLCETCHQRHHHEHDKEHQKEHDLYSVE